MKFEPSVKPLSEDQFKLVKENIITAIEDFSDIAKSRGLKCDKVINPLIKFIQVMEKDQFDFCPTMRPVD